MAEIIHIRNKIHRHIHNPTHKQNPCVYCNPGGYIFKECRSKFTDDGKFTDLLTRYPPNQIQIPKITKWVS